MKVKGQLLFAKPLKQGQHKVLGLTCLCVGSSTVSKIVGVFDATFDACECQNLSKVQLIYKRLGLQQSDLCEYGHLKTHEKLKGSFALEQHVDVEFCKIGGLES